MYAKNIMTPDVITVNAETEVNDIAQIMIDKKVSAIPVLNNERELVGIVSEGDLMCRLSEGAEDNRSWWLKMLSTSSDNAKDFIRAHGRKAESIMTRDVITVGEDTDLNEVAKVLETNRIKRVPVMRDTKIVGIVSRSNLLQIVAHQKSKIGESVSHSDSEIREQIYQYLDTKNLTTHGSLSVFVDGGIVELWGFVDSIPERDALILATSEVEGVKEITDHFSKIDQKIWGT